MLCVINSARRCYGFGHMKADGPASEVAAFAMSRLCRLLGHSPWSDAAGHKPRTAARPCALK